MKSNLNNRIDFLPNLAFFPLKTYFRFRTNQSSFTYGHENHFCSHAFSSHRDSAESNGRRKCYGLPRFNCNPSYHARPTDRFDRCRRQSHQLSRLHKSFLHCTSGKCSVFQSLRRFLRRFLRPRHTAPATTTPSPQAQRSRLGCNLDFRRIYRDQ